MTLEILTSFFGWMSVLNIALLIVSAVLILALKGWAETLHSRMFGLEEADIRQIYFRWLGNYKLLTFVFCIIPYLSLRLVA